MLAKSIVSPFEIFFRRSANCAVSQPLAVVASREKLHRRKEWHDEHLLRVVGDILGDSLDDRHARALEFDKAERDAVHVDDEIGSLVI